MTDTASASEPGARASASGIRRILVRTAQIALTIAATVFIASRMGMTLDELQTVSWSTWKPDWLLLSAASLVLMLSYGVSAALWGRLVHDMGGPELPVFRSIRLFMVANLGRYIPGKVWQIASLAYLARGEGVPVGVATAAAVVGQGIALLAATLIGLGMLFGGPVELGQWGEFGLVVVIILAMLLAIPASFRRIVGAAFRVLGKEAPTRYLGRSTFGLRWLAFYTANWALYAAAFWLLFLAFAEFEPFMRVGPAFAAAYVAGYFAIFAPAGVGVREGFLLVFLAPVIGLEGATVLAIVQRAWTTGVELIPAGIFAVYEAKQARDSSITGTPGV